VCLAFVGCSGSATAPKSQPSPQLSASPSPSPEPEAKVNNKRLIKKTWDTYADAVSFRAAGQAIDVVEHATINYLDEIRFAASNAGPSFILKKPLADRLLIGGLRVRFKPARLLRMDAEDTLRFCFEEGLSGGSLKLRTSKMKLQKIKVQDQQGLAFARFTLENGDGSGKVYFIREGGDWKIDFMPFIRGTSSYLIGLARDEALDPNDLVLQLLEIEAGRPIDSSIWDLPRD
jgi:hypothetical protein